MLKWCGVCLLHATSPLLSLCHYEGIFRHIILTQCPLRVSSKRGAFRLPGGTGNQAFLWPCRISCLLPLHPVVTLHTYDTFVQMTRFLGAYGGAEVLLCGTWILTAVESPLKRVSLKPRVILFLQAKKKQFTLLAAIFCLLCAIMGDVVFAPSQIGSFCAPAGACWEVMYVHREGVAVGSAALELLCSGRKSE